MHLGFLRTILAASIGCAVFVSTAVIQIDEVGAATTRTTPNVHWSTATLDHASSVILSSFVTSNSPGKKTYSASGACSVAAPIPPSTFQTLLTQTSGTCTVSVTIARTKEFNRVHRSKAYVLTTCATGSRCMVGDTGPGGGIVFYDAGSTKSWGRYLEAAPADTSTLLEWGCSGVEVQAADHTAIGKGILNTQAVVATCQGPFSNTTGASAASQAFASGGIGGWYVPDVKELRALYAQAATVGNLNGGLYWTSNEYLAARGTYGRVVDFSSGNIYAEAKVGQFAVRFIRAF